MMALATDSTPAYPSHTQGLVRSIGVSNFSIAKLDRLMGACKVKPSVNQVGRQAGGLGAGAVCTLAFARVHLANCVL